MKKKRKKYYGIKKESYIGTNIIRLAILVVMIAASLMTYGCMNSESESAQTDHVTEITQSEDQDEMNTIEEEQSNDWNDSKETAETATEDTATEDTLDLAPEITPTATQEPITAGDLNIHFLDVHQGTSVLLESDGHYALYDGGDSDRSSFVVAYLKDQGIESLDYVIASHYDADHISGLIGVLNVFDVDTILGPNYVEDTKIYYSFMNKISSKDKNVTYAYAGDRYTLGSVTLEILAPADIHADPNENSIVLRVVCGEKSLLLTGDAGLESETAMLGTSHELSADILVAGHHGSEHSTSDAFLDEVAPEYVVISCGKGNSYGHPSIELMDKIKSKGIRIFRTDLQGTILASIVSDEIAWNMNPSDDYSGGIFVDSNSEETSGDAYENIAEEQIKQEESAGMDYVLNMNTKKFHYPSCSSVDSMKAHNRKDFTGSREEVLGMGYDSCGRCHP